MLRDLILPQSEVIRAILLEHSPCCGGARTGKKILRELMRLQASSESYTTRHVAAEHRTP